MKKTVLVMVSISMAIGGTLIWLTDTKAQTGDVIYALKKDNTITLPEGKKAILIDVVKSTWKGVGGKNVDAIKCHTSFSDEYTIKEIEEEQIKEDGIKETVTVKERTLTGKQKPTFYCEAFNKETLTDAKFAELAVAGRLAKALSGDMLKSLGRVNIDYGSDLGKKWDGLFNPYGKISDVFAAKIWKDGVDIKAQLQRLKVASPGVFRGEHDSGKVGVAIGFVKE